MRLAAMCWASFPRPQRGIAECPARESCPGEAHVLAYRAIHELVPGAQVGWAQHYVVFEPAGGIMDRWVAALLDRLFNHIFFELIETGRLAFLSAC